MICSYDISFCHNKSVRKNINVRKTRKITRLGSYVYEYDIKTFMNDVRKNMFKFD